MFSVIATYQDKEQKHVWVIGEYENEFEATKICKIANKKSQTLWKKRKFEHPNTTDPDCIITEQAYTIYHVEKE